MPRLDFAKAEFKASYGLAAQLPAATLPELVFAGRSNVGKSSLINKLCNRNKLARVSATPGKTATINYYGAGDVYLVDLPGYGYAKTSASERKRWDGLINGFFAGSRDIRLLLLLLDCRHPPSRDDVAMLDYLRHYSIPFVAVLTKSDKLKRTQHAQVADEFEKRLEEYACRAVLLTSAEKREGLPELARCMQAALEEGVR